ncbi:MAG: TraB/GumN family protein [Devosia sp.]|uniref:TraB/GumN family protein n=1 Tax=Devosia sp. TaxID=1871048 RepID=UPI0024C7B8DA|nr:TraB/GumN family protein [Devosia sp.]UYO00039.1 MAG: TraB/GumN family protein [Devosia sp.]
MIGLSFAAPAVAAPALWKVSDADSSVWLFGSVHMLPPGTDWRTSYFDKVLAKADRVYLETDIGPEAQMRITPLSMELGFSTGGVLLSDRVPSDVIDRMRELANEYNVPMPLLLAMRPWMAATTLSVGVLADAGYDPNLGVEMIVTSEVPAERMGYLESPEDQIGILAGGSDEEQVAMLVATLDSAPAMQADIDAMIDAWLGGHPEGLGDAFMAQMGGYHEDTMARLIDIRNSNWVEQIETMLADNESAFLIVGAAHLIGDVSVVKMLEDKGFSAQRMQ